MRMGRRAVVAIGLVALALCASAPALADPIAFTETGTNAGDQFFRIDLGGAGAAAPLPNATGFVLNTPDAKLSPSGVLYAINVGSNFPDQLAIIDQTTGVGTAVGPTGQNANSSRLAFGLDGTLWYLPQGGGTALFTLNTATGAATPAGTIGTPVMTIAALCDGRLVGVTASDSNGTLVAFDPASPGTVQTIGNIGFATSTATFGVSGMDFAADGTLWMIAYDTQTADTSSYTVNLTTGAATLARADTGMPNAGTGLAIAPRSCPTTPITPSDQLVINFAG